MNYDLLMKAKKSLSKKVLFNKHKLSKEQKDYLSILQNNNLPLREIRYIFDLIYSKNTIIQKEISEIIIELLSLFKNKGDYYRTFKYCKINLSDFEYIKTTRINFYPIFLSIASFNSNGFVREKSILELAKLDPNFSIKFILFRLGDWVPEVRLQAKVIFVKFLNIKNIKEVVKNLEYIELMLNVKRVNLQPIYNTAFKFLNQTKPLDFIKRKFNYFNDKQKFILVRNNFSMSFMDMELIGSVKITVANS